MIRFWPVLLFLKALSHPYFSRAPEASQPSDLQLPVRSVTYPIADNTKDASDDVQQPDSKRMKF